MREIYILVVASIFCMHGIYAQDLVSEKMNRIDEIRDSLLARKNEFCSIGFPLKWHDESDSIFYYFRNNRLVLIEHSSDQEIDGDTNVERFITYRRVFFYENKLCLEEEYSKSYEVHIRIDENKSRFIHEMYNYIDEARRYFDIQDDSQLSSVSRVIEAPEAIADSMLNTIDWNYMDISRYRYFKGKHTASNHLGKIEENGFVLPEGVIMPYKE